MSNAWYSENFATSEKDLEDQRDAQAKRQARRIWVKPQTHVDVIFIDQRAFNFLEHKLWSAGESHNFTCIGLSAGCPICIDGIEPKKTTVFSVIDTSKWQDNKGQTHENEKKILALNPEQTEMLRQKMANWGGLAGKVVRIRRNGDKSPASGNDFELLMRDARPIVIDMKKYKDTTPFDYLKIYGPLSRERLVIQYSNVKKAEQAAAAIPLDAAVPHPAVSDNSWGSNTREAAVPDVGVLDESAADIPF